MNINRNKAHAFEQYINTIEHDFITLAINLYYFLLLFNNSFKKRNKKREKKHKVTFSSKNHKQ